MIAALKHRNFRLFWLGQCVSLIGTWMQNVAQAWLVLDITGSAFWLGVVSAIQFLPMLLFSLFAGTLIDRFPKKKMLLLTQASLMVLAFVLTVDIWLHLVKLWHVLILAFLLGVVNTFDMPTRQAFMIELVGKEDLLNAIVLNSSIFHAARVLGPSVAGLVIDRLGVTLCFFINALSFVAVIAGVAMIRLPGRPRTSWRETHHVIEEIKDGLTYVKNSPGVLLPILLLMAVNILALNFNVLVPLLAKNVFHRGAQGFGFLMSASGCGALIGSIVLAARSSRKPNNRALISAAVGLCTAELLVSVLKSYHATLVLLAFTGMFMITFSTTSNSLVQVQTPDHLRGRVMSIYTLVFAGLTPIGSFLSGSAANAFGASFTFGLGAVLCLLVVGIVRYAYAGAFANSRTGY